MNMRPFTKTDWYGLAGAHISDDGTPPHVSQDEVFCGGLPSEVVADDGGVQYIMEEDWEEKNGPSVTHAYHLNLPNVHLALLVARALPQNTAPGELLRLGFEKIL